MGNRANKAQRPPGKASRRLSGKIEAQPATPTVPGPRENVDRTTKTVGSMENVGEAPITKSPALKSPGGELRKTKSTEPRKSHESREKKTKGAHLSAERVRKTVASSKKVKTTSSRKSKPRETKPELAETSLLTATSQFEREKEASRNSKRTANNRTPTMGIEPVTAKLATHQDITKVLVNGFCSATLKKGISGLRQEYAQVKAETIPAADRLTAFAENHQHGRNRYRDVPCVDETRVKLKDHPKGHDYIHANYVTTPFSDKRFICSQAPLPTTCFDFWFMALQEESEFVIMLCNFIEAEKPKCAEYVPFEVGATMTFEDITITVLSMNLLTTEPNTLTEKIVERSMQIKRGEKKHLFTHYHWESWPDHGVPTTDLSSLVLLQRVRQSTKPIIVHCSAGIGRTGSVVAIEFVLERIIFSQPCEDMGEVLKSLRNQRALSIQTDLQYLYVHRILLRYYTELKFIANDEPLLVKFREDYDQAVAFDPRATPVQVQPCPPASSVPPTASSPARTQNSQVRPSDQGPDPVNPNRG